jgi:AraC-like DNA-binding protein
MPRRKYVIYNLCLVLILVLLLTSLFTRIMIRHVQAFELLRRSIYTSPELDWSMQTMSEKVFLSANQLITIYRRLFNTTPKQDLLNARVQKAKTLLQTTLTLREVAALSGFQNEYYFSTAFRKKTGMTPSVFSKANRAQALIPETQEDE